MGFLILYTLSASCHVRDTRAVTKIVFSPSIAHANSADAFISLLLKVLGTHYGRVEKLFLYGI